MSTTDPFTVVYNRLWDIIEGDYYLSSLIKIGSRIKLTGTAQNPLKSNTQDGDKPQLIIAPVGGPLTPHMSSSSVSVTKRYTFAVATGKLTVDSVLFPIQWGLFCVLMKATNNHLCLSFVKDADITEDIFEGADAELPDNDNTSGWSLGLTLSVQMVFNRDNNNVVYP